MKICVGMTPTWLDMSRKQGAVNPMILSTRLQGYVLRSVASKWPNPVSYKPGRDLGTESTFYVQNSA